MHFTQGIVEGRISGLKTEASAENLPLPDDVVADLLLAWRRVTVYRDAEDWVFASPYSKGRPYWPGQLMKSHISPVSESLGFGRVGWHSFRHSSNA